MDRAALQDIHDAFAQPVTWARGGDVVANITAILFHEPGDDPFGEGRSVRRRGYEVRFSDLPDKPANKDIVTDDGVEWSVIDVSDYSEADAWRVFVEKV